MKANYLIRLIEEYCTEKNLDITDTYNKLADLYQDEYGINIIMEMKSKGFYDMPLYLESLGTIERYVELLNRLKRD